MGNTTLEGLSKAELEAKVADLESKLATASALRMKVSEKGCLSLYGLNKKFPVSLYGAQWERLLDFAPQIREFLVTNSKELATK